MNMDEYPDCDTVMLAIERFRAFLNSTWPTLTEILNEHDWDDDVYLLEDWLDANWKLLVSRQLLGKKGDLQPFSVPINDVIKKKLYSNYIESIDGRKIFVSLCSGQTTFAISPPFDKVRVMNENGISEILPLSSLQLKVVTKSNDALLFKKGARKR